jgi:DNA-binding XRE family transcriptional regulator
MRSVLARLEARSSPQAPGARASHSAPRTDAQGARTVLARLRRLPRRGKRPERRPRNAPIPRSGFQPSRRSARPRTPDRTGQRYPVVLRFGCPSNSILMAQPTLHRDELWPVPRSGSGPVTHLRRIRLQAGLRQVDVAEKSHLSRQTIRLLEQGRQRPHLDTARALSAALKVPVEALFPGGEL